MSIIARIKEYLASRAAAKRRRSWKRWRRQPMQGGVGSPACLLLDQWGLMLHYALGEQAYRVGSSIYKKHGWRDVDIRIIMDDDKYDRLFGTDIHNTTNPFWSSMMTAYSLWGQKVTGLPIDFQIHRRRSVKPEDWEKARDPIGIYPVNTPKPPWQNDP